MIKVTKKSMKKWIGIGIGIIITYEISCFMYWASLGISFNEYTKKEDAFRKSSTKVLIRKLHSVDIFSSCPRWAMQELAKRKAREAVPELIKLLNPWHKIRNFDVIYALGEIGDERAIEPLMKIVKRANIEVNVKKPISNDTLEALLALAKLKYEPMYNYAVKLATLEDADDPNNLKGYGITMLGYFEKPEALPILKKISEGKLDWARRSNVENAIKQIESAQNRKSE